MGSQATRMLLDAADGKELAPEPVLLPTRLITRASTLGELAPSTDEDSDPLKWADLNITSRH